jgi:hypothetical protein
LQKGKNIGKGLMKPGAQKGLAVVGGISRIASGIAMGEDKTQAVGAGIGQAAGGMIGAAAGTALLGPFLGPFAPIVGNAIGSFLGEWVGKTFLPVIKPLFEPIGKMFRMLWDLVKGLMKETGYWDFLGTLFKFVGKLGQWLMTILAPLGNFIKIVMGPAISLIGKIIGMVIGAVKNMIAFAANPIGFAWRVIRGKDPGANVDLSEEKAEGGEVKIVKRNVPGSLPLITLHANPIGLAANAIIFLTAPITMPIIFPINDIAGPITILMKLPSGASMVINH